MYSKTLFSTLLLGIAFTAISLAQDGYTVRYDSIQSNILNQNRKIAIFLPESYDKSTDKFPVIYVLDADGRDQHTVPTARFLFLNNKMPKAIIVGVFNIDRNHDFLPDSIKSVPTGGGANNFARFFREELMPYINSGYKAESFNVLVGHSFGGVFAMNVLLTDPGIFDAYIAIDPSFWYKKGMMIGKAQAEFTKQKSWGKVLFIAGREGSALKGMGVSDMDSLLKTSAPSGLAWKVVAYPDEDHGSVTFKSVYDGLRFIFDSGADFDVYPQSGVLAKGTRTIALVTNNNPGLHYTLDGSEPTASSPVCTDTISITGPCTLKVKSLKGNYGRAAAVTRIFTEGEFFQGIKTVKNLKPGLKYSYCEGVWDSVPEFANLKLVKTGIAPDLNLSFAAKNDSFAVRFEGYLHIAKQGIYFIWVTSDDGSKVYINSHLLLDNDRLHDASKPIVKVMPLMPGYYPIKIDYFERTGDQSLTIGTVDSNRRPVPFTKDAFFHRE